MMVSDSTIRQILKDQKVRQATVRESHTWFFHIYLSHYVTNESAPFHKEMFARTEDETNKLDIVIAFRDCGKSTLMTLSYPIWAIMGKQQKKFVVLISQTQRQARMHLQNLKRELESNELLKKDLGPFREESDEWGVFSLVIPKYEAKIMAVSIEQTIRGYRFNQHRPDLIIADDIENLESVKTQEGRDKTFHWVTSEVIPTGNIDTKMIFIGNLLHEDSLLMRLKDKITLGQMDGKVLEVPVLDEDEKITWPGKYRSMRDVEKHRKRIGNDITWQREFMLKIVPDEGAIIKPEWIQYYSELPEKNRENEFRFAIVGVDPATGDGRDYTAMVSMLVYGYEERLKIYVLPNPINEKIGLDGMTAHAKTLSKTIAKGTQVEFIVETVGGFSYAGKALENKKLLIQRIHPIQCKRDRFYGISHLIKDGTILFPATNAEPLIRQGLHFGVEKHDDLIDALVLAVTEIINREHKKIEMGMATGDYWIGGKDPDKKFFAHGQWHYGDKEEYFRKIQEMLDKGLF